jgi:Protein of unknown function (DUF2510)
MSKRKERKAIEAAAQLRATVECHLDWAKTFEPVTAVEVPECPLQAHAGELIYLNGSGAFLVEPRRGAGHWEGRSQGVSVHVPGTKSMRYRVGSNRGTFVQGDERPTPIDKGTFVITNQRAVFIGAKQTREWAWSKLIGFTHATDVPWTSIAVSNRQKNSGVLYDTATEDQLRFMLDLAVARAAGEGDALISQLQAEFEALPTRVSATATRVPAALERETEPAQTPPANWYRDPTGRHELRYWTGTEWSENVTDAGVPAVDPARMDSP